VSQSPTDATANGSEAYLDAWSKLTKMLQSGRSFSGRERNCAFLNTGKLRFANVSASTGLDFADDARGMALTDWDFDGDLDLWISNRTAPRVRFMRNNNQTGHQFLALKLEGKDCNRDAIGARIELYFDENGRPGRTKTVRCGGSFLAQSSKWIHFGLGSAQTIDHINIHWPGGEVQSITGLDVNRYYNIVQDQPARIWSPPVANSRLIPSDLKPAPPTDRTRAILAAPVPLPDLQYKDMQGNTHQLKPEGATLINLWASWCAPCVEELKTFNKQDIQGLNIIALSVDGLDVSQDTTIDDARALVDRLSLSFPTGMANATLLEKLQLLYNAMLQQQQALPVPTSLLIDVEQRVIAMYLGPVSVAQITSDLNQLQEPQVDRRRVASGFDGRFYTRIPVRLPVRLAESFQEKGHLKDAAMYLDILRQYPNISAATLVVAQMNLGNALVQQGQVKQGIVQLKRAVQLNPQHLMTLTNLGTALTIVGSYDQAISYLQKAVQVDKTNPHVHMVLADALYAADQIAPAAKQYEKAMTLSPRSLTHAYNLARVLAFHDDKDLPKINVVNLAEQLATVTQQNDPLIMDVLAAAYAKAGRFDDAVAAEGRAIKLVTKANQTELAGQFQTRRDAYRRGERAGLAINTP
jgi:Flp pilus assembly protein TadD